MESGRWHLQTALPAVVGVFHGWTKPVHEHDNRIIQTNNQYTLPISRYTVPVYLYLRAV
jgi:hypothetical protein